MRRIGMIRSDYGGSVLVGKVCYRRVMDLGFFGVGIKYYERVCGYLYEGEYRGRYSFEDYSEYGEYLRYVYNRIREGNIYSL